MKLISLIEEDGQDQNQPLDPHIQDYNEITEPILKFIKSGWRRPIQFNDNDSYGVYSLSYLPYLKPEQYKTDDWGFISIGVHFEPFITSKSPAIPLTVIADPYNHFVKELENAVPELTAGGVGRVELNRIKVKVRDIHIKLGSALYSLTELIGISLHNEKVRGVEMSLGDLLIDGPGITDELILNETELPKFDPDFKKIHDRAINKATAVVKAYRKGKWRGHTYDLGDNGRGKIDILLLDYHKEPVVKDGVIRPFTKVHLQLPSPIMDGYNRWSDKEQYPLSDDELKEFYKYMNDKIFSKFGIVY